MAEPFVIVNRRCLPSPALPFSFLPPWLFYLLRKQKRSRVSAQGGKCTQRLGVHTDPPLPPTDRGRGSPVSPARRGHPGTGGRDAPGSADPLSAPCRDRLYGSEQHWEIHHLKLSDLGLLKVLHEAQSWFGGFFSSVVIFWILKAGAAVPALQIIHKGIFPSASFERCSLPGFATF